MVRLLATLWVLVLSAAALAGPMTRWTNPAFEGTGQRLVAGGAGNATLVVLRENQDPVRSLDGGKNWSVFTVRGSRPLDVSVLPADGMTWYAVVGEQGPPYSSHQVIWRTREGGNTWEERARMSGYGLAAPLMRRDSDVLYMQRSSRPPAASSARPPMSTCSRRGTAVSPGRNRRRR